VKNKILELFVILSEAKDLLFWQTG